MNQLDKALDDTKELLKLKNNWSDVRFLIILDNNCRYRFNKNFIKPQVCPGQNGSIDLHWKLANKELLLNIPKDLSLEMSYHGDDRH